MNTRKRILLPVCAALAMIPLILLKAQEAAPLREPGVAINPGLGLSEGRVSPPFTPVEEQLGGMVSYDNGFLVNMSLDVDMSPGLRLFFGMIGNVQRKLLASANGMGNGFWVYEQTGYESQ